MTYLVEITCDNAAFHPRPEHQIVSILRDMADRIERDGDAEIEHLRDVNGNTVGHAGYVE